jgi:protein-S-isoprenylcysteine O-methyltransferase Ste14
MAQARSLFGAAFFLFAAVLAGMAAWEKPSILAVLNTGHNVILAFLYATRLPARKTDRTGLILGLMAALLPILSETNPAGISPTLTAIGVAGELLVLWSLIKLGRRFGIAPADRGLVVSGPYRFVRHPMYAGELILRLALSAGSAESSSAWFLIPLMLVLQALRAIREERVIKGYADYANSVRWRFLPGVF